MTIVSSKPLVIGEAIEGGTFAGVIRMGDQKFGIVVAAKAVGEKSAAWHTASTDILGARSFFDGMANTEAMAEAGSELAQWARGLVIEGFDDWHIPARDELELLYRNLKPTSRANYPYRGDNPSSVPPGYCYAEQTPAQTTVAAFRAGGADAFDEEWYWASTQFSRDVAWLQGFYYGGQYGNGKSWEARCRVVRRFAIE